MHKELYIYSDLLSKRYFTYKSNHIRNTLPYLLHTFKSTLFVINAFKNNFSVKITRFPPKYLPCQCSSVHTPFSSPW